MNRLISTLVVFCSTVLGQSWIQLNPAGTPPAIVPTESVAYDQPGNHLIVFDQNLVWVLSNANGLGGPPVWTQLHPVGPLPPGRDAGTVAYDPGSNRLILFGGGYPAPDNDTWILTNANGTGGTPQWIEILSGSSGPQPPRSFNSTVYDVRDNRLIIFGGGASFQFNDVWVLSDANGIGTPTWTQLFPTGGPPVTRCCLAAGYDPGSNRMMIFGGDLGPTGANDSWVLTNANGLTGSPQWIQLSPANPPLDRYNMAFGYNPNTNELIITQGVSNDPGGGGFTDPSTWKLDGANGTGAAVWTQICPTPTCTPQTPSRQGLEYDGAMDPVNNRMIMFGGGGLNDVWVLVLPAPIAQQDGPYQIGYAANLNIGDSVVNLSNSGANGGVYGAAPATLGNICVNIYVFDPQEEEIGCCACPVTPNGLNSLSAKSDLISNNLTPAVPASIVIKLVASTPAIDSTGNFTICNPTSAGAGTATATTNGLLAWGTTLEPASTPGTYNGVRVPFLNGSLSAGSLAIPSAPGSELAALTSLCNFIQANGTGYGICKSCRAGALAGSKRF